MDKAIEFSRGNIVALVLFFSLWTCLYAGVELFKTMADIKFFTKCVDEGAVQIFDESKGREIRVECKVKGVSSEY
ncbi:hypothetical protein N480_21235 [Pseudoalteromonas luteoviolacea S2607]|uniref:hypothetical protein n=1 Tax=Pseudoalteromonas luteoviolacea TaxID=43657 RepID=UPI0007B0BDC8|nr:hypothetical protein [Pseudoalteromonas luteoviolacea]KZN34551.1 hypothetical protein N480_21235 [Pseudoalteromonas luteoviolacea S2607]